MRILNPRNVHEALPMALELLAEEGQERDSRAGKVMVCPVPVTTVYDRPEERVLFWAKRDANPFFHFMEGLWMLAGRDDVAWISRFSSNIAQFSDDGIAFHGAYGYRWRNFFAIDQLRTIVNRLRENPDDRRCVLGIWSPHHDLDREGKDVPCNLNVHFTISADKKLDMTVFNRSNDIIWGCYGANAVHFSMLQEFMAGMIQLEVGRYWQVSGNWHGYVDTLEKCEDVLFEDYPNPYVSGKVTSYPMMTVAPETWYQDLMIFMDEGPIIGFRDRFFRRAVTPIWHSWFAYKNKQDPDRFDNALGIVQQCEATDWRMACTEWLLRRKLKSDVPSSAGKQVL